MLDDESWACSAGRLALETLDPSINTFWDNYLISRLI
jgi:hypothetical protein